MHTAAISPSIAERRAMAIGINDYDNFERLALAENDAVSVETTLKKIGFRTTLVRNDEGDLKSISTKLQEFTESIQPGDDVIFAFFGHGIQAGQLNYLLPKDAPAPNMGEDTVADQSLRLDLTMERISSRNPRFALYIIDACRENPFNAANTREPSKPNGLASIVPLGSSIIVYSAGANKSAYDHLGPHDKSKNSPFTRTLLPFLENKKISLNDAIKRVQGQVAALTKDQKYGRQEPAYYDGTVGLVFLGGGVRDTSCQGKKKKYCIGKCLWIRGESGGYCRAVRRDAAQVDR